MTDSLALFSRKGQLKIQQMAFVLVAFVILLGLAGVFFITVKARSLQTDAQEIRSEQAREAVRKLTGLPELAWTADDCASCIDLDKAFVLVNESSFESLWGENILSLSLRKLETNDTREIPCTAGTYPSCTTVTLFNRIGDYHTEEAFVALCQIKNGQRFCSLGKMLMGVAST